MLSLPPSQVHSRDVIEKLIKSGCSSPENFVWLQQLRAYWDKSKDDCVFKITNTVTPYGPSSAPLFAARTLNDTAQSRVTLSL